MWTRLRQGLRFATRGDRMNDDIHREIDAHLQMEIDHRVAAGALPEDARRAALREFGRVDLAEEQVRDVRGLTFWDHLMQDLRFGARTLRRSPGYAFAAILTLGLGIGANSAMFSVINGTLLHPLPYRDSSRLIRIRNDAPLANRQDVGVSIAETRDLRQRLGALESFVEYHHMRTSGVQSKLSATGETGAMTARSARTASDATSRPRAPPTSDSTKPSMMS